MSSGIIILGSDPMPTELAEIILSHGGGGLTWNRWNGVWSLPWPRHGYEVNLCKASPDAWQVDVLLAGRKSVYGAIMLTTTVDTQFRKILSYLAAPEPRFAHLPEFLQQQAEHFLDLHDGWITKWQVSDKPTDPERLRIVWERRALKRSRSGPVDKVERAYLECTEAGSWATHWQAGHDAGTVYWGSEPLSRVDEFAEFIKRFRRAPHL